jgi:hypothetical protein
MNAATLIAVTDDSHTCDCCGKTNLKRVAVLQLADGSVVRYGRDCAARKLGKVIGKAIDTKVEEVNTLNTIKSLIAKWEGKHSTEVIVNHIHVKFGYYLTLKEGQWMNGKVAI